MAFSSITADQLTNKMVVLKKKKLEALQAWQEENNAVKVKRPSSPTFAGHILKRIKWVQFSLILSVCLGILIYQGSQCVRRFISKSTGTADKYVHISNTSFPVLDLCPSANYNSTVL